MVKMKKILKYSEETMLNALSDVTNGMSYRAASIKYGVPRITLMRKHKGNLPAKSKMGPATLFTEEQENILVHWIITMAKAGFPVSKETLLSSVAKLATEYNIKFGGNANPGRKWYNLFLSRHPNISIRTSQNLVRSRSLVSEADISNWFREVKSYMDQNELTSILNDPRRVFNTDETAFFLNPKPGKVLAQQGSKNIYTGAGADEKDNITVLLTANAAGQLPPPMVVYRFVRVPQHIVAGIPPDWAIGKSENGWMTQELFYEYICNIFFKWVQQQNIPLPVIFFMDGHSSHVSLPLSKFCTRNGIELVALYPNATHVLQPMDVAVFHTMKTIWRQKVQEWRMENEGKQVGKVEFAKVLQSVLPYVTPKIVQSGFKKCGLVPWDPQQVKLPFQSENTSQADRTTKNFEENMLLRLLEKQIGIEKVQIFKRSGENWEGAIEDKSLFDLWKRNKVKMDDMETAPQENNLRASPQNRTTNEMQDQRTPLKQINENIESVYSPQNLPSTSTTIKEHDCVPTPFKKNLFWPLAPTNNKKRRVRDKLPAVVTSPQVIQYLQKKEETKKKKEDDKEKRKQVREAKKIEKEEQKKMAAEEKRKKKQKREISSSSDSSVSVETGSDIEVEENNSDVNEENIELVNNFCKENLKEGDFILAKFMGGKRSTTEFIYLCVIEHLYEDMAQILGFKSAETTKREFVVDEGDVSSITFDQIITILPSPEIQMKGERFRYIFNKPLKVKEKI